MDANKARLISCIDDDLLMLQKALDATPDWVDTSTTERVLRLLEGLRTTVSNTPVSSISTVLGRQLVDHIKAGRGEVFGFYTAYDRYRVVKRVWGHSKHFETKSKDWVFLDRHLN